MTACDENLKHYYACWFDSKLTYKKWPKLSCPLILFVFQTELFSLQSTARILTLKLSRYLTQNIPLNTVCVFAEMSAGL